ncbi:type I methionyl aminopeptidase [bacterium]|nr:type I methionyl aminopeptidase [bacterium]
MSPIIIKTEEEISAMRASGAITGELLRLIADWIVPGITTAEIDRRAEDFIRSRGAVPAFKGLYGFPGTVCASVNEEVVHGIPGERVLLEGDIISIDTGAIWGGYFSDAARTYPVGCVKPEVKKLVEETEKSFEAGVKIIKAGVRLGDVSHAIQSHAEKFGYGVVREYVGHGVGRKLHEPPDIPNFGKKGTGPVLQAGMTLAIEPMIALGKPGVRVLRDGWTAVTRDGLPCAHHENTVLVTVNGSEILTKAK